MAEIQVRELQQLHEAWTAFKTEHERLESEVKKYGEATEATKAAVASLDEKVESKVTAIDERIAKAEKNEAMQARLDELEALLRRKGNAYTDVDEKKVDTQRRKALLFKGLRNPFSDPDKLFTAEEKAMVLNNDPTGGYLSPPEYVNEILADIVEYSPIRTVARQRSTTAAEVRIPKRTTTAAATWVHETGTRSETQNPAFGQETLRTHEMTGLVKVSKQDLEDTVFDLEAFIRAELAEQFGVTEGTAFVSGTAVGQPEGILTNSDIASVDNGHATVLQADGLIALYYELKEAYVNNATWAMRRSTLKTIRQLKDGTGNYLWAPGIKTEGSPATILDRPYITCPDMPAIASAAYPIAIGDFRRGFLIVDRLAMEMLTDPYTSKNQGMVEFSARKRVGAQVVIAEAIKKLKMAA